MSERIEPTPTEQPNEEIDSDFDTFDAFSDLFLDEDSTEHQPFMDSLLFSSEG